MSTNDQFNQIDLGGDADLTAYALGELPGEERAAIEQRLARDPGARLFVEQTRHTAIALAGELAAEAEPLLTSQQRKAVMAAGTTQPQPTVARLARLWFSAGFAAAASLAIVAGAILMSAEGDAPSKSPAPEGALASAASARDQGGSFHKSAKDVRTRLEAPSPSMDKPKEVAPDALLALAREGERSASIPGAANDAAGLAGQSPQSRPTFGGELPSSTLDGAPRLLTAAASPEGAPASPTGQGPPETPAASPPAEPFGGGYGIGGGTGGGGGNPTSGSFPGKRTNHGARVARPGSNESSVSAPPPASIGTAGAYRTVDVYEEKFGALDAAGRRRSVREQPNTETYEYVADNPFLLATEHPLSTFSVDVDTASYANLRRFIMQNNTLPPAESVRIEEMLNYFPYDYAAPGPESEHPFAVHVEVNQAPWNPEHRLLRVALKGREMKMDQRPATSLVFLIDVSGSMQPANKLPLLKQSMKLLVDQLHSDDRVAIVTYAGNSGVALPSTYVSDKQAVVNAIDNLRSGGSTNGGAGIQLAYDIAVQNFIAGGVNRVILATDGDFNVGVTDDASLVRLIEEKRKTGVFLSVLGFGQGNLKDAKMEQLADKGNGAYAYIDTLNEGRKVLVEQATGTLVTIAKDVKLQIEFNPLEVNSYRLIGYENRVLAKEDFNNDRKDAGDIGAGHAVTALYELVPARQRAPGGGDDGHRPLVDSLKYQKPAAVPSDVADTGELMTLKLRYKQPDGEVSRLIELPVRDAGRNLPSASGDFQFAAAVASIGMILRNSPYRGSTTFEQALALAESGVGEDSGGYRSEFIELARRARSILDRQPPPGVFSPQR